MQGSRLNPGFMVIHGNRTELLRQLMVHWFSMHPLPPLQDEIILVQSSGIAQWLKMSLAQQPRPDHTGGLGIAAALDMQLPSRFTWQAYRAVLGDDNVPLNSVFDKSFLVWRLMRLLPGLIHQPGYEPLARFLNDDQDLRKRYQLAENIADLLDQYQVYRSDWLQSWSEGKAVLPQLNGAPLELDEENRWQALLWQTLLNDVGPDQNTSRAAIHQQFLHHLQTLDERPATLPERVSVFGISSLPEQSLEVLLGISRFSQVLLFVQNPCEHYWANILTARDHARRQSRRHRPKPGTPNDLNDDNLHLHAHPLLAAWGRQGRDYIALLDELDQPDHYRAHFTALGERIDLFSDPGGDTLLQQLHSDILNLRSLPDLRADPWPALNLSNDQSIRFHRTHSIQREVEVLHDQLLHVLNTCTDMKPRDILVMVPDVNLYAPHIHAVFGLLDNQDKRTIPFSISDQKQRQQAPIISALECLLNVPESRLGVSELLDLLDIEAVRLRFGLTENDIPILHQWIHRANIRWGLDPTHRQRFTSLNLMQNTWLQGMRRMLLGYATGDDPTGRTRSDWHDIEPLADVAGLEASIVGGLAELLHQLTRLNHTLEQPTPPQEWQERLNTLIQTFFQASSLHERQLIEQLQTALADWYTTCDQAALKEALPLSVVREHWLAQIDQTRLTQRFQAGRLTFATLMPMRAIPFRMICLLGMNDGDFPRSRPPVDFDLMAREVRPGDRSRREDDRYLFLEALLSARERLYISWVGRNIQDNTERPASVLVSQLLEHLDSGWTLADAPGVAISHALTTDHPLQPFSAAYFTHQNGPLFTYAHEWEYPQQASATSTLSLQGSEPAHEAGSNNLQSAAPLPVFLPEDTIGLDYLESFLKAPVNFFYKTRLKVHSSAPDGLSDDHERFQLDALEQWSLQNELIQARHDALDQGHDEHEAVERTVDRFSRRGELPFGALADVTRNTLTAPLEAMFKNLKAERAELATREPVTLSVQIRWGEHSLLVQGKCSDLYGPANALPEEINCRIELIPSQLIKKQEYRLDRMAGAWIRHLFCNAYLQSCQTVLIGKDEGVVRLQAMSQSEARALFEDLARAMAEALQRPIPLEPASGYAWLKAYRKHRAKAQTRELSTDTASEAAELSADTVSEAAEEMTALHAAQAAAITIYEGQTQFPGVVSRNPILLRQYPTFDALWHEGQFRVWCERLLLPVMTHVGTPSKDRTSP